MGRRNYLVEGVSCTGKTTVAVELERRGYDVVHGDRVLAYQGDPVTGAPTETASHEHHLWDLGKLRELVADVTAEATYVCGGSRNVAQAVDLFDEVFVLTVDRDTLLARLDRRPDGEWGHLPGERALVLELHRTGLDVPAGTAIDAIRPVTEVVDDLLRRTVRPPG